MLTHGFYTAALDQVMSSAVQQLNLVQLPDIATNPLVLKIATAILAGVYLLRFVYTWAREAGHIRTESGYSPPLPRLWARLLALGLARLSTALLVGRTTVRGAEAALKHRKRYRYVVVSNHQIQQDATVLGKLAKLRRWRFMVAMEEVRRPLLAPLYALVGAVPVIRRGSKAARDPAVSALAAAAAVTGAVQALANDKKAGLRQRGLIGTLMLCALWGLTAAQHMSWWIVVPLAVLSVLGLIDLFDRQITHFLVFIQGKLIPSDELKLEDFRSGPVRIARQLQEETGDEVALLMVHIRYSYEPRAAGLLTRLLMLVHFPRRFFGAGPVYRADVSVSDPFPLKTLSPDDDTVGALIFNEMVRLKNSSAPPQHESDSL